MLLQPEKNYTSVYVKKQLKMGIKCMSLFLKVNLKQKLNKNGLYLKKLTLSYWLVYGRRLLDSEFIASNG